MRRAILAVAVLALATLPLGAAAHVTVWPRQSELGAREAYVVRMPNEKKAATVRLDAEFPPAARVTSIRQAPGWRIEIKRDGAGAITGASWSGELPPDQYVEFGVQAVNPKAGAALTWKFVQTYADGAKVEWTGGPGTPTPAPQVLLRAGAEAEAHRH